MVVSAGCEDATSSSTLPSCLGSPDCTAGSANCSSNRTTLPYTAGLLIFTRWPLISWLSIGALKPITDASRDWDIP
jgi:hypothetical protein